MRRPFFRPLFFILAVCLAAGSVYAQTDTENPTEGYAILLQDKIPLQRFETAPEALAFWRSYSAQQPSLLLLSNNPHLGRTPDAAKKRADALVTLGSDADLLQGGNQHLSDPAYISAMVVDLALRHDLFKSMSWALPIRDIAKDIDLEKFRSQLVASGVATETEAKGLSQTDRIITGQLRDKPFMAAALPLQQNIEGPVLVHIDLSYFQPLYKNEITTPLLKIVSETLRTLRKMHLPVLAVTFSYGHLDDQMSLDVRFIGDILDYLVDDPTHLEQPVPLHWQKQAEALYLGNFFQKEKVRELFLQQEQLLPNAGWVKFNLFRSAVDNKEGQQALDYLAQAVELDKLYALEYLELSTMAYEKGRPDEALRMLELSMEVFPDNVHIPLQTAQLAIEIGEVQKARELVTKLQAHRWSPIYYPQIPELLSHMAQIVGSTATQSPPSGRDEASSRQRVLHLQLTSKDPGPAVEQQNQSHAMPPSTGAGDASPRQRILHRQSMP